MTIYISAFLILLIIAILIHQHKIKKEIQKTKEEAEKINKKIEDLLTKSINNKEHCGYVSADLPKQIVNLQNKLSEFTTLLFKIIDEHTKNNSDFINKSLNDIKKQLSDSLEMIGDLYNFQPKMLNEINEGYSDFVDKTTKIFLELKEHILSKQEISKGEYLIFIKLIFDIFILKSTKIIFECIDDEIILHFSAKNTQYKSKINDISNDILYSLENIKYTFEHQIYTKTQILALREQIVDEVFEKMNQFMISKSIKTINEFNKNEIKTHISNIIIDICEQKKIEVVDEIRG